MTSSCYLQFNSIPHRTPTQNTPNLAQWRNNLFYFGIVSGNETKFTFKFISCKRSDFIYFKRVFLVLSCLPTDCIKYFRCWYCSVNQIVFRVIPCTESSKVKERVCAKCKHAEIDTRIIWIFARTTNEWMRQCDDILTSITKLSTYCRTNWTLHFSAEQRSHFSLSLLSHSLSMDLNCTSFLLLNNKFYFEVYLLSSFIPVYLPHFVPNDPFYK